LPLTSAQDRLALGDLDLEEPVGAWRVASVRRRVDCWRRRKNRLSVLEVRTMQFAIAIELRIVLRFIN
jgi:hypothetical protein